MTQMYGSLVNSLIFLMSNVVNLWMFEKDPVPEARSIILMYIAVLVLSCFSYWKTDPSASVLSVLIMAALTVEQHARPWPHADQVLIQPQFLWTLLVITGNRPLSLQVKTGLALLVLTAAITASYISPLVRVADNLPLFLTATLMFFSIPPLLLGSFGRNKAWASQLTWG